MAIESSRFFLVKIVGTPPTYNNIGAQSDGRLGMNAQRIDTSNKTTLNWRTGLGGLREFVVDCSGFADWPDTLGLDKALDTAIAGSDVSIRVVTNSLGDNFQAMTQITSLELNGANNNATQYSMTFELSQGAPLQDVSP